MVGAVGDPGAQVLVGERQRAVPHLADPEVRVGARDVLVQVVRDGDVEALVEPSDALERFAAEEQRGADVVEGVGLDVPVADGPGERDGARAQLERLGYPTGEHGQLGLVADGHRQLVSGRQRFEGGDGQVAVPFGVLAAAEEPAQPRHPALVRADDLRGRVDLLVELEGAAAGRERRLGLVGQVALVRQVVVEVGGTRVVEDLGEPQGQAVLAGGLPVGAETGGVGGRGDGVPHCVLVPPAPRGVVRQAVVVGRTRSGEGGEGGRVHLAAYRLGQAGLDRLPGDLVAEVEAGAVVVDDQHPVVHALVDRLRALPGDLAEQGQRGSGSEDGGGVHDVAGGGGEVGQPGQHGVADRRRGVGRAAGQDLA